MGYVFIQEHTPKRHVFKRGRTTYSKYDHSRLNSQHNWEPYMVLKSMRVFTLKRNNTFV